MANRADIQITEEYFERPDPEPVVVRGPSGPPPILFVFIGLGLIVLCVLMLLSITH